MSRRRRCSVKSPLFVPRLLSHHARMETGKRTSAVLLAGGRSRRMGRDKACLPFGEGVLGGRVHTALRQVFEEVVVVTDRPEAFPVAGARCVPDGHPGRGPLEGLASGLAAVRADRVLLAACDMPFLPEALLRFLAAQPDVADVIVPCGPSGREPLLALYHRRLLPALHVALERGERRMMGFLASSGARLIPWTVVRAYDPEGRAFRNLNRPEDYRAALALLSGPSPT